MDGVWSVNTAEVCWLKKLKKKKKKLFFLKEGTAGREGCPDKAPGAWLGTELGAGAVAGPCLAAASPQPGAPQVGAGRLHGVWSLVGAVTEGSSSAGPCCRASEVRGKPVSGQVWLLSYSCRVTPGESPERKAVGCSRSCPFLPLLCPADSPVT